MLLIREETWDAVNAPEEGDPENYSLVQSANTAKQAWDNLENAFQDDGMTRRIGLLRKLTSIR